MPSVLKKFPNDPLPTRVVGGKGIYLFLEDGSKLLDFTGGWTAHSVFGIGDQGLKDAINKQLDIYAHLDGNVWTNPMLDELAKITVSQAPSGLNKVFLGDVMVPMRWNRQ